MGTIVLVYDATKDHNEHELQLAVNHIRMRGDILLSGDSLIVLGVVHNILHPKAGGVVTDAAGSPLDFSKGKFLDLDTGIIVTNQKLMPLLLKAVRDSLSEASQATPSL